MGRRRKRNRRKRRRRRRKNKGKQEEKEKVDEEYEDGRVRDDNDDFGDAAKADDPGRANDDDESLYVNLRMTMITGTLECAIVQ